VDKALQDAQIKLSDVVSDLFGMSGRAMLDALVAGERNPRTLADLAKGNLVKMKPALIEALTGQFEDHHARLLRLLLGTVDHLTAQLGELDRLIARTLEEITTPPDRSGTGSEPATTVSARALAERLDAVPGIGPATAQIILAEIGADMSRFPTPEHLVSWAKLCPRTIQSRKTARVRPGRATPGSRAPSARPPTPPPAPTPSSAPATAASSNAVATPKPWSPSPARYSSSPGT
jgi:DNA uptake protein ComE-like DNA-binding protein